MAKVYVIHKAFRWEAGERRVFDYTPAADYGKLVLVFDAHRAPGLAQAVPKLRTVFADFKPEDYLVMSGDTELVIAASVLALRTTPALKLLKWNNRNKTYDVVTLKGIQ